MTTTTTREERLAAARVALAERLAAWGVGCNIDCPEATEIYATITTRGSYRATKIARE